MNKNPKLLNSFSKKMESTPERIPCILCGTSYANRKTYMRHLNTNSHKSKDPNNINPIIEFQCEKCNVTCSCLDTYKRHFKSKKHNMGSEEYKNYLSQRAKEEKMLLYMVKKMNYSC